MKIQEKDIKEIVKSKYNQIADQSNDESCCCCKGDSAAWDKDYTIFSESYKKLEGYSEDADLGLGCGLPTQFAQISKGDTVLDLGSGAGNDCFVARAVVGESGKVIGVDFADKMLEKARKNAQVLGYQNVEFLKGDIDQLPIEDDSIDVVVSNCVLNLVPDKVKVFAEIHRVLKPAGHFSVSDIVISGTLPEKLLKEAEMYAGCVAGAIANTAYIGIIKSQGFTEIKVPKVKEIHIPDETLEKYLNAEELENYRNSDIGIFSMTVFAKK
ncbi:MAG: arsenite methyltransferase [Bacteroidetes bacterium]|nr:arsenite methyltransferase [Bacteroidota bacterium]